MKEICQKYGEALVSGDSLAKWSDHVASCDTCAGLGRTHQAATALSGGEAEPSPGFVNRISAGATTMLSERRRKRRTFALASAALVSASAVAVVVVGPRFGSKPSDNPSHDGSSAATQALLPVTDKGPVPVPVALDQAELKQVKKALINWIHLERSIVRKGKLPSVKWQEITSPLDAYRGQLHASSLVKKGQ